MKRKLFKGVLFMKDLNYYKKRKEESTAEQAKTAAELDSMRQNLAALDEEITAAVDAENLDLVADLNAQKMKLSNRIQAAEMIAARKKEKGAFSREEVAAANNDEMKRLQDEYNTAMETADKLHLDYIRALIVAAEIMQKAKNVRAEYLALVGTKEIQDVSNQGNSDFKKVCGSYDGQLTFKENETVNKMRPGAVVLINSMRRGL